MFPENYGPAQVGYIQNFSGKGMAPQLYFFPVEDLAAGGDIAARVLATVPTGYELTILDAKIIPNGDDAGIDASNTCVVALANGSNTIVTKTYNGTVTFPDSNAAGSLGTLSATYQKIAAGGTLKLSVTNGATANTPPFVVQLLVSLDQVFG